MANVVYSKAMENLRKPSSMLQKIFDSGLVTMRKSKVTLILNKLAYFGMCILELSNVLM